MLRKKKATRCILYLRCVSCFRISDGLNRESTELDTEAVRQEQMPSSEALCSLQILPTYKSPFDSEWTHPPSKSQHLLKSLWQRWNLRELSAHWELLYLYSRTEIEVFCHVAGLIWTWQWQYSPETAHLAEPSMFCRVSVQHVGLVFSIIWISCVFFRHVLPDQIRPCNWSDNLVSKLDWEW